MDEFMGDSDQLDIAAATLIDLANFGLPQVPDALFGTPSQESAQHMQVENTGTLEHMDEATVSEVSSHVDTYETVFTNSSCQNHVGLEYAIQSEALSECDKYEETYEPQEESEEEDTREPLNYELSQGFRILREVMADSNKSVNWPFMNEVDPVKDGVYDYHERVERPMWLRKMKEKFDKREYDSITEFVADFRLMLENCYRYNGPDHAISKRGQRLETILEQKLTLLSRELREKTSISATSGRRMEEKQISGTRRRKVLVPHDSTALLNQLRMEEKEREKEARKVQMAERQKEREQFISELQGWEETLMDDKVDHFKAMWELPQIGHFLFLCQGPLNIGEVIQYELERGFYMPRESQTFQNVMTTLLSTPYQRTRLESKPMMPYKVWDEKLRVKLRQWYKVYRDTKKDWKKTCSKFGLDQNFFKMVGNKNPLETKKYHELSVYQRVWLVKGLCDNCLDTQESLREAMETQAGIEQRAYELGTDADGNRYIHFPQFCGADLRVYKQAPFQYPKTKRKPKSPSRRDTPSPTKVQKKKSGRTKAPKPVRSTPSPSPSRQRHSRLRQNPRQAAQYKAGDSSSSSDESENESRVTEGGDESEGPTPRKQPRVSSAKRAPASSTPSEIPESAGNPLLLRRSLRKVLEESKNINTATPASDHSRDATPTRSSLRKVASELTLSRSSTPSLSSSKSSVSAKSQARDESRETSPAPSGTDSVGSPRKGVWRGGRRKRGRKGRGKGKIKKTEGNASAGEDAGNDVDDEEESSVSHPFESYKDNDNDSLAGKTNTSSTCSTFKGKLVSNTPSPDLDKMDGRVSAVSEKAPSESELADDEPSLPDTTSTTRSSSSTDASVAHKDASLLNGPAESSASPGPHPNNSTMDSDVVNNITLKENRSSVLENGIFADSPVSSISGQTEPSKDFKLEMHDGSGDASETAELQVKKEVTDSDLNGGLMRGNGESPFETKPDAIQLANNLVKQEDGNMMSDLVNGIGKEGVESTVKLESDNEKEAGEVKEENLVCDTDCKTIAEGIKTEPSDAMEVENQTDLIPPQAIKQESSEDEWEEQIPELSQFELVADSVDALKELSNQFAEPEPVMIGTGKKQKVIKPVPRKKCVAELHDKLLFLLKELEPWETKLLQANRKARMKMRREHEAYKEEPEEKEIEDVWESEESGSESSSEEAESEDSQKPAESEDVEKEGKLRSGKVLRKEEAPAEEFTEEVSSRGRVRKRKVIPNGAEDDTVKRGRLVPGSSSPTPTILQKNKNALTPQGLKMTNLGQLRLQQPQGVSLLGGNQTLLIQGVGAQQKGANSALAMKNATLFAQLTNKNPAQQPQAQPINLKPGQNVNEVIKQLLASGKQVAITANPQQLQMIAAQHQPKGGAARLQTPQQMVLTPQQAPGHGQPTMTSPMALKPKPTITVQSAAAGQSAIASLLTSPQKNIAKPTVTVANTNVAGTQYFSYNNLGQLPANVIQELLKKQNARLQTETSKAGATEPVKSQPPGVTMIANPNAKQGGILLAPGVINQQGVPPNLVLQKGGVVSPVKAMTSGDKTVLVQSKSVAITSTVPQQNAQGKVLLPPNKGVPATVSFNIPPQRSSLLGMLGSPPKPKYAGNVTVKTLLEKRAAGGKEETKTGASPVLLNPGVVTMASAAVSSPQTVVAASKPAPLAAVGSSPRPSAIPASSTPNIQFVTSPVVAGKPAIQASAVLSTNVASCVPVPSGSVVHNKPVTQMDACVSKANVITMPRLLLQGSNPIGQIPANLLPAAVEASKVTGATQVIGGEKIRALITGGGKGPQVTTITTGQLQAAIAKKQAIDNAVKAVFTTGVSTSLPTAQIKVSSPFAMPSRNPHRPVTITTSAMKAPIPALPQITSNEIKMKNSETNSVCAVKGSLTTSAVPAGKALTTQADLSCSESVATPSGGGQQITAVQASGVTEAAENSPTKAMATSPAKPLAVKVTSQNIRTSQGVVPSVILPQGVTIPPQVLQQLIGKQPGVVFLQQGKDGSMQVVQVPNNPAAAAAQPAADHSPGKLELPRVPTPTILKPAVPSEAANLQQQKLLQQQAAAAKGIVSHQVSDPMKAVLSDHQQVVSSAHTTLTPQQLVSPTSVTVLPTQTVAIKGQAGTHIVSPSGSQMIASKLLLSATNIQQQHQIVRPIVQSQGAAVPNVQLASANSISPKPATMLSAKIQPQAIKLGTVPVSAISAAATNKTVIVPQMLSQASGNQKVVLQTQLGSPTRTTQLTQAQLQALQQQLVQLQAKNNSAQPRLQTAQVSLQNVNSVGAATVSAAALQTAAASPRALPNILAASPKKTTMMVPNAALQNVGKQGQQAGKLVLFNVNGQLVTAQGVPVNLGQGAIKVGQAGAVSMSGQTIKPGAVVQTAVQSQVQKQLVLPAGSATHPGAQVIGKLPTGQMVIQNQAIAGRQIINAGQVIQGSSVVTRPVLQQGQIVLQPGQVLAQPGSIQLLARPAANLTVATAPGAVQLVNTTTKPSETPPDGTE